MYNNKPNNLTFKRAKELNRWFSKGGMQRSLQKPSPLIPLISALQNSQADISELEASLVYTS